MREPFAAAQVVIVGRLASMTRAEAGRAIAARGGELAERVTRATNCVVLGGRGPQLARSGRMLGQLARARRLAQQGVALEVWSEEEWLAWLGLADESAGVRKRFTAGQMAEALEVPRARIDRWLAAGLVHPVEESAGLALFDFRQVAAARTLAELVQAGIKLDRIQTALAALARWLPEVGQPLADLSLSEDARRLMVRTPDGRAAETSGQLLFDFDVEEEQPAIGFFRSETESEAFCRAMACEEEQPQEAAVIYRGLIAEHGPHPTLAFNLGNSLYAADDVEGALAEYQRAAELSPGHSGAWNNLANVLAELDRLEEAAGAYRQALWLDATCADAHFNLAMTLVELGRPAEAVLHWRAYLAADPDSAWADYARERLESVRY